MKKLLFLMAVCMTFVFTACNEDKTTEESKNTAPTCKITSPVPDAVHDINLPLVIEGKASDAENNITEVTLTVGENVIEEVTSVPFTYEIAPENLQAGSLLITLHVKDKGGLTAQHQVTVVLKKMAELMNGDDGGRDMTIGYWTSERELKVLTDKKWTVSVADPWFQFYDKIAQKWVTKTSVSGEGKTTLKIRATANEQYIPKYATLEITAVDEYGTFEIMQEESPDMLFLLEDEMLRMAAQISMIMYGIDLDEDGMISAFEAEQQPEAGRPYGIDAGAWEVKTTKGIENFPHLRHLDVNSNPLTEIDLSKNPELMSLHVHSCNNLKSLDISKQTNLIEIGCNYDIFLSVLPEVMKRKTKYHTFGIFFRQPDQTSDLDFSGFTNLQRLYVNDNGLTSLKITGCRKLWRLVAQGNAFTELDLSEVEVYPDNQYLMGNCPNLKKIYVWSGFTLDFYNLFIFDEGVEIIEK